MGCHARLGFSLEDCITRAREIEARIEQIIQRQICFSQWYRTQAAALRHSHSEQSRFPELRARMLGLALSYERMADSAEQFVLGKASGRNWKIVPLQSAITAKRLKCLPSAET